MENYLVELAKSRKTIVDAILNTNFSFTGHTMKMNELNKQLQKIDELIDKVIEPTQTKEESKPE